MDEIIVPMAADAATDVVAEVMVDTVVEESSAMETSVEEVLAA